MGGTRDGEVYEILSDKHKAELERITNQTLVPLSSDEATLVKLIDDSKAKADMFREKFENPDNDLENQMRDWLRKKGKI